MTPDPRTATDGEWRRAAMRRFAVPVALAVAGLLIALLADGTLSIVGWGVVAVAATIAISLAFLEVGYSEDRARARGEQGPYG